MKQKYFLSMAFASLFLAQPLVANDQFNQGMQQGKANKGQGADAIQGFKPAEVIPGYTTSPSESGYYGGVNSSGVDMTSPGSTTMNSSEAGKTITESILNTPADNKPSLDAPFIAEGLNMQAKAETITGGGFNGCVDQPASFTEITTHQCLRDTKIEQYCTRTATLGYEGSTTWEVREVVYKLYDLPSREVNGNMVVTVTPQISGEITAAYYSYPKSLLPGSNPSMTISVLGNNITWNSKSSATNVSFKPSPATLTAGVPFESRHPRKTGSITFKRHTQLDLRFVLRVKKNTYIPKVTWSESCPFSKTEGAMTGSQCVEPGGTRTIVVGGQTLSMYQSCWKWKDTYLTQVETDGTCGEYMKDKACTVTRSQCADTVDGFCVSQQVTYSCERKKEGNGQICGGEFFCKDGSCAQGQTGTSNMFGQAVSALAAVAAAGKDVAELNGENVRAFTGEAKSCKKMAVGFNNCCKDSGWGQDVGLSSCSSDEKALGKAKDKKLTVYVGEYCSKDVLGVCLEKKRGYCQFDSKLARIVQEQGRRDQLGISFGKGKSPDCRGITVDELQRLDFGVMNFSDFYSDLDAGSDIPEDQALLKKAQDIIAEKMQESAQ
ncbi:type-F conjugative transfer system mating-pair stabilization protein TraN (plasmid) [Escherichia albertii]|nr:type-F conjugative transfer system mating-pair stabilization protein TraN [Escherichia albertii]QST30867.1 type-F conjugative transfer system mating-pair stabilization protein TraN [Escherichia albertii]QST40322.1 type-F conjugative transfer system mating-pair stabilization protein TraN [Escherichia albertii]